MADQIERPEIVTDDHLAYLDALRENGQTNMLGAGKYLEWNFPLTRQEANTVLKYWMASFGKRN